MNGDARRPERKRQSVWRLSRTFALSRAANDDPEVIDVVDGEPDPCSG